MNTMIRNLFIYTIIGLYLCINGFSAPVKLKFPDGLSWKAVFDSGCRPKHILGLQNECAECTDQEVIIKIIDKPDFGLDRGRLMFEMQSDDSIRVIEHVSRVPISMQEGEQRMKRFRSLFKQPLFRNGSVPPMMDAKHGSVMATSDDYACAVDRGYVIHFGFTSSFQRDKPLIPIFMITLDRKMEDPQLPIRLKIIEPPAGYEWYSMDPKVSSPGPGTMVSESPNSETETKIPIKKNPDMSKLAYSDDHSDNAKFVGRDMGLDWLLVGLCVALIVGVVTIKMLVSRGQ